MLTDVPGVAVGSWTDARARTGCTVALFPEGTAAAAEVRGSAPATRELDLLAPHRTVARIDAVLLTGGSAFGLAAADGVMRWCEERGRGVPTPAGPVPIVPALGLFDLMTGDASVRPGPDAGHAACEAAGEGPVELGAVGAGTGATVGAWRGDPRPGALCGATVRAGEVVVSSLVAVNAFGDPDFDGGGLDRAVEHVAAHDGRLLTGPLIGNTTIGVVATNARLTKTQCVILAQGAVEGLSRSVAPAHTSVDGDAMIGAATGQVEADPDGVRVLAAAAVARAIRDLSGR
ncbi:MAG TPA: P1 family peptidase [Solirubrobacteraceae bacterium]